LSLAQDRFSHAWAAKAARLGYRWKIGNGEKILFWEDNWLGTSSLAIQFWKLYTLVNEKNKTVAELWDGQDLKCTLRRTASIDIQNQRDEVFQLASTISFSHCEDEMILSYTSNGIYSSQTLYKIINYRGITPVYIPSVWSLYVPPRIHFFLWLFSQNQILTRDNLGKRKHLENKKCMFCDEDESVMHLFFNCMVARQMWVYISLVLDVHCGNDFESIAKMWLSRKKFVVANILTSAALWGLRKLRNFLCFQNGNWKDMANLLHKVLGIAHNWRLVCPQAIMRRDLDLKLDHLKSLAKQPARLSM
jgi:hypothetical protein